MTDSPFMTPDPLLAVGTTHAGFTVTSVEQVHELSGCAYVMRHDATGARLVWLACDDVNKAFCIGFKTPPADDTGVFHILEHSVLCGSDRFPVKEPFVNLLKSSMQTFLNAMTYPDKTIYPVASTNTQDLENLMDVYLDAVLHPAIYQRPRIFEQEGWHLELDDADAPLRYNGVVFNEMKGALSDPDDVLYHELNAALFPNTPYAFESGGNPRAIPTLTYEKFIDTHARHYTLPNSYTVLYGDLDIERELAFVAERFAGATDRHAGDPNPLPMQSAVMPKMATTTMATAPENAQVGLGYVIGTSDRRERVMAASVLMDALCGSNEAPLKRAVLDAGLADDFVAIIADGTQQPFVMFQLRGAKPGVAQEFRDLVEKSCSQLASEGIPRINLEAALAQAEFTLREGDFGGAPDGIAYSIMVLSSWLYDDDEPLLYLRYENELAHLKAQLEGGYFEDLLRELIVDSAHAAEVELVPVEEGDAAEEEAELAKRKAQMSPEELEAVIAEVAALREEQEAPDTPEDLAKLPMLTPADVDDPKPEPRPFDADAPLPCIAHELDTHAIDYVYHYFGLDCVTFEELPYVTVLAKLLGTLATESHTAAELDTYVELNLGSLDFICETPSRDGDLDYVHPQFVVGACALSQKIEALASIPQEVWGTTRFDDHERIRATLTQQRIGIEQGFMSSGHSAALARIGSYFSKGGVCSQALTGVDYYLFLRELLDDFDARADALCAKLADLCRRIFRADNVIVSFTGSAEDRERFWLAGGTLGLSDATCEAVLQVPEPEVKNEAFVVPSNVCFACEAQGPSDADPARVGVWQVAGRVLSFDYLWNEVRVKGGAYGVGFRRGITGTTSFWSYRDPAVDPSVARYEAAAAWLANWQPTDEELGGYIVSVVASHDAPLKPRQLARRQDGQRFSGRDEHWRDRVRAEELACTVDDVHALAPVLAELPSRRAFCVFGGREKIEASELDLTVIDLMGTE